MKCVKTIFKDILLYAPNWSDEQGNSYGCFSGFFVTQNWDFKKKNILGTCLGKLRTTYTTKKSNSIILI